MLSFDNDPDWLARLNGQVKDIVQSQGCEKPKRAPKPVAENLTAKPGSVWLIPKISHSAYKTFEKCPRHYQHQYVLQDIERTETESTIWGTQVHTAFEEYVRDSKPLPETMKHWEKFAKAFVKMPGEKHVERGVFLNQQLELVELDSPDVWLKAYIDLMVWQPEKQTVVICDWKTGGSKYVDTAQLRLYCLLAFKLWPEAKQCKAAYCWLKEDRMGEVMTMDRSEIDSEWSKISDGWEKLDSAFRFDRWNKRTGPLCSWCDVKKQGKCSG